MNPRMMLLVLATLLFTCAWQNDRPAHAVPQGRSAGRTTTPSALAVLTGNRSATVVNTVAHTRAEGRWAADRLQASAARYFAEVRPAFRRRTE